MYFIKKNTKTFDYKNIIEILNEIHIYSDEILVLFDNMERYIHHSDILRRNLNYSLSYISMIKYIKKYKTSTIEIKKIREAMLSESVECADKLNLDRIDKLSESSILKFYSINKKLSKKEIKKDNDEKIRVRRLAEDYANSIDYEVGNKYYKKMLSIIDSYNGQDCINELKKIKRFSKILHIKRTNMVNIINEFNIEIHKIA